MAKFECIVERIHYSKPAAYGEEGHYRFIFATDQTREGRPVKVLGNALPSTVDIGAKVIVEGPDDESRAWEFNDKYRTWSFNATSIEPDATDSDVVYKLMVYYLRAHRDERLVQEGIQTTFPCSEGETVCLLNLMALHNWKRILQFWKKGNTEDVRTAIQTVVNYFHPSLGYRYKKAEPYLLPGAVNEIAEKLANWMMAHEDIFTIFADAGMSPEMCQAFAPTYTPEYIQKRPMLLATPFVRVPFAKTVEVDRVLREKDLTEDGHEVDRLHALMLHLLLEEDRENKSTFLSHDTMINLVERYYSQFFDRTLAEDEDYEEEFGLDFDACFPGDGNPFGLIDVVLEDDQGTIAFWQRASIARAEAVCASAMRLRYGFKNQTKKSLQLAIQKVVETPFPGGGTLDDSQKAAVESVFGSGAVTVITGPPGTGKTTIIRRVIDVLQILGYQPTMVAPTGKAAVRMTETTGLEARTIHSMFGFDFGRGEITSHIPEGIVIVDETSMVPVRLLASMFEKAYGEDVLFGQPGARVGVKFILVGDADQLPPIPAGQPFEDYVLEEKCADAVARLTVIHRQSEGSVIPDIAQCFLNQDPELPEGDDCVVEKIGGRSPEQLCERFLDLMEEREIQLSDFFVATPQYSYTFGVDAMNKAMQSLFHEDDAFLQISSKRAIFEGQPVVCKENNYDRNVMNGTVGQVQAISSEDKTVHVEYAGVEEVQSYTFSEARQELMPAYALTIHKCQGSEAPAVMVVLSRQHQMLKRRLAYTAVTRARKFLYIVYDDQGLDRAMRSNDEIENPRFREDRFSMLATYLGEDSYLTQVLDQVRHFIHRP